MDTKKICIFRYGCAAHADTFQQLIKNLEGKYEETTNPMEADVIIQYFCAHTSYVIEQIYGQMQCLKAIKEICPHIKLIICGCAAEVIDFKKLYPIVDFCSKRENMLKNILQFLQEPYITEEFDIIINKEMGHSSITIATGCNGKCSFCKWKYLPMRLRSKPKEQIISEIRVAIEAGAGKITLFAHNSIQYGVDLYAKPMLLDLLKEILSNTQDVLFRVSGITVADMTEELCEFIKNSNRIHSMQLESQSASNLVRKKMNLASTVEQLEYVLDSFTNKAFLTTFMIGYPYEGEAEFQETIDFIKRKKLWNAKIVNYVNTPGIVSSKMPQVSEEEINERIKVAIKTVIGLRKEFFGNLIGKTIKAYVIRGEYYENERFELVFEGKEIRCTIRVIVAYTREIKERIDHLEWFDECDIRIVRILGYFTTNQEVELEGELI